uniref:NADH-ubiquinone oxidoreductase chain 3 n=1 Tax=Stygobromus allegheniensis TaxID=1677011 RepID=A0A6C0X598_9CRUS|nr:NADH dehydrogenase subunit 3 [Stygobromus allegheniensis]QIC54424.1 NADH dehydrogenase subunit 3 [Stygobromus allegheniensis]
MIISLAPIISLTLLISSILGILALSTGKHSLKEREMLSPFECGFDPWKKARTPFSLRFFLVTIIFLIFDVEIALLLPLGILVYSPQPEIMIFTALILMTILIAGLFHEWRLGSLNWA